MSWDITGYQMARPPQVDEIVEVEAHLLLRKPSAPWVLNINFPTCTSLYNPVFF
jgi:hypothetical protein